MFSSTWNSFRLNKAENRSSTGASASPSVSASIFLLFLLNFINLSAKSLLTATVLVVLPLVEILLSRLASIFSLIFLLRYSSYSKGLLTALIFVYNFISMKKPCMYPFNMGVPISPTAPSSSNSTLVTNL